MIEAVLLNFNGVIINDEPIHRQLIEEILLGENLVLKKGEYQQLCFGSSDRTCLQDLLASRGRVVDDKYLTPILQNKAQRYTQQLEKLDKLPLYPGLDDLLFQLRSRNLKLGIVSGAMRQEIEFVLNRAELLEYFAVIVAGDDVSPGSTEGYLLAVELLNQKYSQLNLQPGECLVIENTPLGIQLAKQARMHVVGIANTYPFHMLQRQANWTVDYFTDLELERVEKIYSQTPKQPTVEE